MYLRMYVQWIFARLKHGKSWIFSRRYRDLTRASSRPDVIVKKLVIVFIFAPIVSGENLFCGFENYSSTSIGSFLGAEVGVIGLNDLLCWSAYGNPCTGVCGALEMDSKPRVDTVDIADIGTMGDSGIS